MAEDQKVKMKDVGGVSAGSSGATLWHVEAAGEKWTFRTGRGSRILDVHWSKPGQGKKTLWVARSREFLRWAVRTVRDDVALAALDAVSAPVSREWIEGEGLWLSPMPVHEAEEAARLSKLFGRQSAEAVLQAEPGLVPRPLPFDLAVHAARPGAHLAFSDPATGGGVWGVVIWTPGAGERTLLWVEAADLVERCWEWAAPYIAELRAMDRPEVRAELTAYLSTRSRGKAA